MKIGDKIAYIRHDMQTKKIIEGEGYVEAFGLDHEKRVIALVIDAKDGNKFHVFEKAINPSEEFKTLFKELVASVVAIEKDYNGRVKEITQEGNNKIGKLHDDVLGTPVELPVQAATPQATTNKANAA